MNEISMRAIALLVVVTACRSSTPAPAVSPNESTHQGVFFLHRFTGGGDSNAPLIVALHGRGDSPEGFAGLWEGFPARAEIAIPRGLDRYGTGWRWFDSSRSDTDAVLSSSIEAAEKKLWPAIEELAHGRPIVVTGFSQGAMMTFLIAAKHPARVTLAVPVAGMLPRGLYPTTASAPLFVLHGEIDEMIPKALGADTVDAFKAAGATTELRGYPNVGHSISPEMREVLWAQISAALR